MALRGNLSRSFLRSKELLSYSEISYDMEGNYIYDKGILKKALARDTNGKLIRNKANIAKILNKYGIIYRMVFNAMNMDQYTYDEVQESLNHLSNYINDLGVSGIVEFHAADKTQNSDHIHFWINTEDRFIYNKIAQEIVTMGYSNKEDVYIQKYENNEKLDESEYVNDKNYPLKNKSLIKPINTSLSSLKDKYNTVLNNINNLFKKNYQDNKQPSNKNSFIDEKQKRFNKYLNSPFKMNFISKNCTLPKTDEINNILKKIDKLQEEIDK
jgi:hypothetical protein